MSNPLRRKHTPAPRATPVRSKAPISPHQEVIYAAVTSSKDNIAVNAVAGSGKTTTLVGCAERLPGNNLAVAFNKTIQEELQSRTKSSAKAMTLHGLGMRLLYQMYGSVNFDPKQESPHIAILRSRIGDELSLPEKWNPWRGSYAVYDLFSKLRNGVVVDPEETQFTSAGKPIPQNLVDFAFTYRGDWIEEIQTNREDISIDYDDMVFVPAIVMIDEESPYTDWNFLVDEAQDLNPYQLQLIKLLAPQRTIFFGDPNQCQPGDAQVWMTGGGTKPISEVKVGDRVVAFSSRGSNFVGKRTQGKKVEEVASRKYRGKLIEVTAGKKTSQYTPNHKCLVRLNVGEKHAVYLMGCGNQYRVGSCQAKYFQAFGPAMRARQEGADTVWLLSLHNDATEALNQEHHIQGLYKIPGICFNKTEHARLFWQAFGDNEDEARELLVDTGRNIRYPIWRHGRCEDKEPTSYSFVTQACNLIDGAFLVATATTQKATRPTWLPARVRRIDYNGMVYSLRVEPTEKTSARRTEGRRVYVADGIVTHNSIYAWRGALPNAFNQCKETFSCIDLPLSVSWRCPRAVVAAARHYVPRIDHAENAPEGYFGDRTLEDLQRDAAPTDMVVCRNNAPIIKLCVADLLDGKPSRVLGQDIKGTLTKIGKDVLCESLDETLAEIMVRKNKIASDSPKSVMIDLLEAVAEIYGSLTDYVTDGTGKKLYGSYCQRINYLFREGDKQCLTYSTIHRAKGSEADTVWFYLPDLIPSRYAKTEDELQQEDNLAYVAITRAKKNLYRVYG